MSREQIYQELKTEYERRTGLSFDEFEDTQAWVSEVESSDWKVKQCIDYIIERYDLIDFDCKYQLEKPYEGMPEWVKTGTVVICNSIDGRPDANSFIPEDGNIEDFTHLSTEELLNHPEEWVPVK